jgi:hypothetical protein
MIAITIGIVDVASLTALIGWGPAVTITSGFAATNSPASCGRRSVRPSASRTGMLAVRPSTKPTSRSPAISGCSWFGNFVRYSNTPTTGSPAWAGSAADARKGGFLSFADTRANRKVAL